MLRIYLTILALIATPQVLWPHCLPALPTLSVPIYVNQFGYTTSMQKVAVAADPQTGYNAATSYTLPSTLQVRRKVDRGIAFTGSTTAWNSGAVHGQSGDVVRWFDFSALVAPGEYYIYDSSQNARSDFFVIADTAYETLLRQAVRTYYYQRSGLAKAAPYTDPKWAD